MKEVDKPFKCKKCNRGFTEERYLKRHLQRKIPCDKKFICDKCGVEFSSNNTLQNHKNRATSCVPESIPVIKNDNTEFRCQYCSKTYSTSYNLKRHMGTCDKEKNLAHVIDMMIERDRKRDERDRKRDEREQRLLDIIEKNGLSPQTVINNTLNQTVNNNLYVNVTICSFGKEDLSRIDQGEVMNLLKNHANEFIPRMIEHVHANPNMPEYHNVFYDPERNKAIVFAPSSDNTTTWQMREFAEVSAALTEKIKEHIRPGNGPYFDEASKNKDYDTANNIIKIGQEIDWYTPSVNEQNQIALAQVTKNKEFMQQVNVIE
jgi:hypothetical protein